MGLLTTRPARLLGDLLACGLDWIYPPHCRECGEPIADGGRFHLCARCRADLRHCRLAPPYCLTCALPLAGAASHDIQCIRCIAEQRHFDTARAFATYTRPVPSLIKSYKFNGQLALGPRLLDALIEAGWMPDNVEHADAIVPVPLHPRRRRERGYDQAVLLAEVVARHLGLPIIRRALVRRRYTSQQSLLRRKKRWDNVRAAFRVVRPEKVRGRKLLLVDDVMTTGATFDECARVLKRAKAEAVHALALARALP